MADLIIRFFARFDNSSIDELIRTYGPLFHRWLPDGEKDAIIISTGHKNIEIKYWFQQRGYLEYGLIKYDHNRQEVDDAIISRQAVLDAGPLVGELLLKKIGQEDIESLEKHKVNDPKYVRLGKEIIDLIYPPTKRIVDILKINFGQYWLREFEPWDSRRFKLGNYCNAYLQMQWSIDNRNNWQEFNPTDSGVILNVESPSDADFQEYMNEIDFNMITALVDQKYSPSLPEITLASAHNFLAQGNIKHSVIEAVTALELSIHGYYRTRIKEDKKLIDSFKSFYELPIRGQMIAISAALPEFDKDLVKKAGDVIDLRHKIVHEGFTPNNNTETVDKIKSLFKVITYINKSPVFKFPVFMASNRLYPVNDQNVVDSKTTN